jgi:hypothetical protein
MVLKSSLQKIHEPKNILLRFSNKFQISNCESLQLTPIHAVGALVRNLSSYISNENIDERAHPGVIIDLQNGVLKM